MKILKRLSVLCIIGLMSVSAVGCGGNNVDEVSSNEKKIQIGEGDNKVDGLLTLPEGVENPPVIILVQGSGQSDMNETIGKGENKPFKDIAQGLAEEGIATIRYNKRYYQYPKLAPKDLTVQDEILNDVNSAIEFAYNNEEVNNNKIYVLGHSQGGMVAPEIAKNNNKVTGIISLAGTPRKLEDVILDQNKDALDKMTDKTEAEKTAMLDEVKTEINKIKVLNPNDDQTTILGINSEYWVSLNNLNTPEVVKSLEIPMLFLQGDADFQVYKDVDFKAWQDILEGKDNATFISYPELNHLFMKTNGKSDITEYDTKGTVDAKVISDIAQWVNK